MTGFATKWPVSSEGVPSTSMQRGLRSGAVWLASATPDVVNDFLHGLSEQAFLALPWLFEFWALPHQIAPDGAWRTWVIMGGRGAGKTRAGAEWVRGQVEGAGPADPGRARRVALVGETVDQVREVMIFGESGIMACAPPDRRPAWEAGRKRLVWPNGAVAQVISAHDPESLRGPQFDAAWADELAKWPKGHETWDMLQFALRLGEMPQAVVTTTPRNVAVLKAVLKHPSTVVTHAPTAANRANLAESFLAEMEARYGGTRRGMEELDGLLVEDAEGALWPREVIVAAQGKPVPAISRIVVAVDPPASAGAGADECGILVVGAMLEGPPQDWRAVVLEDASVQGLGAAGWAGAAVEAFRRHGADRMVAEANMGGDLVAAVIRQQDAFLPLTLVHASKGKAVRAEPVAALYEQGRVAHGPGLARLEAQMGQMTRGGFTGAGSPDRVDALVWALTELMVDRAAAWRRPQMRSL